MSQKIEVQERIQGLKVGDKIIISPVSGRKKVIKLNRTRYFFKKSTTGELIVDGNYISLPGPLPPTFHCELQLVGRDEGESFFTCVSFNNDFFEHNGNYSLCSALEKNDLLSFGYNKIQCVCGQGQTLTNEFVPKRIIESDVNILLNGETGVGKSYLASQVHEKSLRNGRFVQLNLASFSEKLIESELFGHVKGAFTGAHKSKLGAIAEASHGTLFIDEIDSLSLSLQTKLLLFLDTKEYREVGGFGTKKANLRLIFASGRPLRKLVDQGLFRADLFFRIQSGFCAEIPPLRERDDYIEFLLNDFCQKHCLSYSWSLLCFYKNLSWPGNIRQFLGHLEKKKILTKSSKLCLSLEDEQLAEVGPNLFELNKEKEETLSLNELESRYIAQTYRKYNHRSDVTSKVLGISPTTLRKKLKRIQGQAS